MWFSNSERRENSKLLGCLLLNTDEFTIETPLRDEITIFRVRKIWKKLLKDQLMLDENRDFKLVTLRAGEEKALALHCSFLTSFGRYAFWRVASLQANDLLDDLLAPFNKKKLPEPSIITLNKQVPNTGPKIVAKEDKSDDIKHDYVEHVWGNFVSKVQRILCRK